MTQPTGPLAGTRILDLTHVLAGPFATMILADLGAEVIKVEAPQAPDYSRSIGPYQGEISHYFLSVNRGKRSLSMDIKSEAGARLARELALKCEVVVENFRPGVLKRLGLDYATLSALKPSIIVCSVSGFGQTGPWSEKGSVDVVVQALSGVMSLNGEEDGPPQKLGIPMGDLAGAMWAAVGVLAALHSRDQTGRGSYVDVSLLDSLVSMLSYLGQLYLSTGEPPPRAGNRHHMIPGFGRYETADGDIVVSVQMQALWLGFCAAADRPDLATDPAYLTVPDRRAHFEEVEELVSSILATRTSAQWQERLDRAGVPNAPVTSVSDALDSEHAEARRLVREFEQPGAGPVRVVGPVLRYLAGVEEPTVGPAPLLGADSRDILTRLLGVSGVEVDRLVAEGVVREAPGPS